MNICLCKLIFLILKNKLRTNVCIPEGILLPSDLNIEILNTKNIILVALVHGLIK